MGAQGTTCATYPPSLLYEGKSECKRVWVPTLHVELVSLVLLASVSLIPLDSLVALSWLGDHVDFELGVAAGFGLRLLGLRLLPLIGFLLELLEHSSTLLIFN